MRDGRLAHGGGGIILAEARIGGERAAGQHGERYGGEAKLENAVPRVIVMLVL